MTQQEAIRELRKQLKLNQFDFAKKIGRSKQTIDRYEADLPADLALMLALVAHDEGHLDLESVFRRFAGGTDSTGKASQSHEKNPGQTDTNSDIGGESVQRWHALLDLVLQSGYPAFIEAITKNLKAFSLAADLAHKNGVDRNADALDGRVAELIEESRRAQERSTEIDEGDQQTKRGGSKGPA